MSSSSVERADARPAAGLQLPTSLEWAANTEAWRLFPDDVEPIEYNGRTLQKIVVDRGNLRYALVHGALWAAGGWDKFPDATPAPNDFTAWRAVLNHMENALRHMGCPSCRRELEHGISLAQAALSSEVQTGIPSEASTGNPATDEPNTSLHSEEKEETR